MKLAALFLLAFAFQFRAVTPDIPATVPDPAYPLKVHIFIAKAIGNGGSGYDGFGRADLLGPNPRGFDFRFSCDTPFQPNIQAADFYQARWRKPDQRLQLLMQSIGGNHLSHCDLNIAFKAAPYGIHPHP